MAFYITRDHSPPGETWWRQRIERRIKKLSTPCGIRTHDLRIMCATTVQQQSLPKPDSKLCSSLGPSQNYYRPKFRSFLISTKILAAKVKAFKFLSCYWSEALIYNLCRTKIEACLKTLPKYLALNFLSEQNVNTLLSLDTPSSILQRDENEVRRICRELLNLVAGIYDCCVWVLTQGHVFD